MIKYFLRYFVLVFFQFILINYMNYPAPKAGNPIKFISADNPGIQYYGKWDFSDYCILSSHGRAYIFAQNFQERSIWNQNRR